MMGNKIIGKIFSIICSKDYFGDLEMWIIIDKFRFFKFLELDVSDWIF